jgi:NAD-dependent deacetylase
MQYKDQIRKLHDMIEQSGNIVFFGGAGVSTESNIPDFRSADGLYSQKYKYPPEYMLSHTFYAGHTDEFFDFYRDKILCPWAKPNDAHKTLARLEAAGKLKAVITQNIDGLHQAAGSKNVLELHGSVHRNTCERCGRHYPLEAVIESAGVPRCECGGTIKPDVVLYEEGLDSKTIDDAVSFIRAADLLIVGGTSLVVYPAAGLLREYGGGKLVLINKGKTQYDSSAVLAIDEKVGQTLRAAWPPEDAQA